MTQLLEKAFQAASQLPTEVQDLLASWLLTEIAAEDAFDATIARTTGKLSRMARAALTEFDAGETEDITEIVRHQ